MAQKICPICDQVMHSAHYCRTCRRWVKNPYVREATYYLNERHPEDEANCTYHTSAEPEKETIRPKRTREKKLSKNVGAIIIVVVLVLVNVVPSLIELGYDAVNMLFAPSKTPEYEVDMGEIYEEESWEMSGLELEDAEVIAAGEACNSVEHFSVSGREIAPSLISVVGDYGLSVGNQSEYSYNEEEDGSTWYATWADYELENDATSVYQYLEVEYDTATEALHEIDICLENPEILAGLTRDVLNVLEIHGGILPEENCAQAIEDEMVAALRTDEFFYTNSGDLYVNVDFFGDSYLVQIYRYAE